MTESVTEPSAPKRLGLVIVNTGNGKGKTTAALGTALRACGYGLKVVMIQFIKGPWKTGEQVSAARLAPEFELIKAGKGFYRIMGDRIPEEVHRKAAAEGFALAEEKVRSGAYDIVILDEINNAVSDGLLSIEQVLDLVDRKPPELHLVLTGRAAHERLIERAHMVTEMREVKHPYQQGILAQKGIDF
ncbi:MAG: cob(I)yrinic acid a,c-diamide adenosyltransferase [Acidobacteria bacterium]|nr:cob(I)yrinic acid a,c-diamide adenosyltransferase [Acidobacteriota bacterium]